ncbi:MAG: Crp/Fnr family transcriptional regulator [Bdellovibrionota bacterium]|nr:Crp/Fnr family transcriptional regulator [Bdellovibrionota bacterium]
MSKASNKLECENCPSKGQGIFCQLEGMALHDVSDHKVVNSYKKGQTLFVQGNPPYGMYCVSTGNIKVTQVGEDGKESIVRIASAGDVLGHRSIFTDQFYNATATAVEDCTVCFLDKKYILKLVEQSPSVACNLIAKLGRDLGAAEKRISSFYQKNVRERLAELLLLLKESHGVEEDGKIRLNIKLTREEMASIIGTASETLIRFMSELKQEGFIEQKGKVIYILDEPGLLDFANITY